MTFGTGARYRCWTEEECEAFIDMAARRVSTRAIGRALGRTMTALHLKASRLGIRLRSPRGRPRKRTFLLPTADSRIVATGLAPPSSARDAFDAIEAAYDAAAGVASRRSGRSMSARARQPRRSDGLSPCPFTSEDP